MKILTLNTWQERGPSWKNRWEVIFQGIEEHKPDVIGFQEMFNEKWVAEVKKRTGYHSAVFTLDHPGQMILTKHRVIESQGLTIQSKSPSEDYLRQVIYAKIDIDSTPLHFFNTHLSWKLDEGDVRVQQVGDLIDYVDEKAVAAEAIFVGDFNAPPETPEIRRMVVEGKFNDCYRALHPKEAGLSWDNRNPYAAGGTRMPDRRLDYIFTRNPSKLLARLEAVELVFTEPDQNGVYASDHFGVLAQFEV